MLITGWIVPCGAQTNTLGKSVLSGLCAAQGSPESVVFDLSLLSSHQPCQRLPPSPPASSSVKPKHRPGPVRPGWDWGTGRWTTGPKGETCCFPGSARVHAPVHRSCSWCSPDQKIKSPKLLSRAKKSLHVVTLEENKWCRGFRPRRQRSLGIGRACRADDGAAGAAVLRFSSRNISTSRKHGAGALHTCTHPRWPEHRYYVVRFTLKQDS